MPMLKRPWEKYAPFIGPDLPDRQWPSRRIEKAPRWLTTDLRDGNQSLARPMTIEQKMAYFEMLVNLGYKEIEISIPTASSTEYGFTRKLIETPSAVPDDSLRGANKAIISLYFASSPVWLATVFKMTEQQVRNKVTEAVSYVKSITKDDPETRGTTWNLMFSPEAFSASDLDYCLQLCEAVKAIWEPSIEVPMILNLPATVESSTPNIYADQVEIFSRSISDREKVCVSLHVHNDRGCAVAAAELGLLAGAERVEGCLFGNGERSGNVDLVTLALNLYTQGVDPGVDFSDISSLRAVVEELTQIQVHPRAPYVGELIFAAYSGAHQDAIRKGLLQYELDPGKYQNLWKVPYLPLDPEDLGSSRSDIIRLNSQSGKGGVSWTLAHELHVKLPEMLEYQFSKVVKATSEAAGGTLSSTNVAELFLKHYRISQQDPRIVMAELKRTGHPVCHDQVLIEGTNDPSKLTEAMIRIKIHALLYIGGKQQRLHGEGRNASSALIGALKGASLGKFTFHISRCALDPPQRDLTTFIVVECQSADHSRSGWGDLCEPEQDVF
ncbi:hypothetical protein EKO27_g6690 [Xylaria grammica]|uniref:2-isopropylmalate synthase n=1 Tax=Xylaria grammica TaxID=363999 RepID=A0A439D1Y2_9PEZI|nr:hypothetical protein EKO27_g6690 [Xylaria grammica]